MKRSSIAFAGLKYFAFIVFFQLGTTYVHAQEKFATKTGRVDFFSETLLEDIHAVNKKAELLLDAKKGTLQFSVPMKAFEFAQSLMQEHFNDDYVESDKYPRSEFKGTILNNAAINYAKAGTYPVKVKGKLTLHGVTKDIEASGTIQVSQAALSANSSFFILLSDYGIKLSSLASTMINNKIKIVVNSQMSPE